MNIWLALGVIGLGMVVAHAYNWLAWRKFYEGQRLAQNYKRKEQGRVN